MDTDADVVDSESDREEEDFQPPAAIKSEPIDEQITPNIDEEAASEQVTLDVLKSFSKKEKKLLLKRLIHLERKSKDRK